MPSSFCGVSVTSDARYVYAAELESSRGKPLLKSLTQVEIGSLGFKEAVRQTLEKAAVRGKKAILALSGHEAIVRCFDLPFIPRREVTNAVRFEAQKYMPFEAKELNYDFETFPDIKSRKLRVVFLAAKKDLVSQWIEALSEAGLKVSAVEPDILALLRLSKVRTGTKNHEVQAFISARADGSLDVVVAKNHSALMARYGIVAASPSTEDSHFAGNFEPFAKEIALSFNYFSKNFKSEEIRRIFWIADPNYDSQRWVQGLRVRFELPVEEWNLSNFMGKAEIVSPAAAILIGAALRPAKQLIGLIPGFSRRRIPDLLPPLDEPKAAPALPWEEEKKILIRHGGKAAAVALAGIFSGHLFFSPGIDSERKKTGVLTDRSLTQLKETKSRLETKVSNLNAVLDKEIFWTEKLSRVAYHVPPEMQLTQIEATDTKDDIGDSSAGLRLEGNVVVSEPGQQLPVANRFVGALAADVDFMKGFDSVLLTKVRKAQNGANPSLTLMFFTIECASKRKTAS